MKRVVIKVLSVITALCVFLGLMVIGVSASDGKLYTVDPISIIQFSPATELETDNNNSMNKFYSTSGSVDTTKYFFNQLTGIQKNFYEQILEAGPTTSLTIDLTGLSITGTGTSSSVAKNNAGTKVQQDFIMAISAIVEDNPIAFWYSGFSFKYGSSTTYSGGTYTAKITSIVLELGFDTNHYSGTSDILAKQEAVINKLETIEVNGFSRHEKLKSIHDYLANNIVYDDLQSVANTYDVYGALINGVCVCEGYAEAFKLICDREGIPCITVVGTGNGGAHKWNMVQMEDGEWYTIDATWDDQTNYIYNSYFLIGSNTKAPYFNSTVADSTMHIPTGKMFSNATKAFTYPTLSTDTYGVGIFNYISGDVHFDTSKNIFMMGMNESSPTLYLVSNDTFSRSVTGSGGMGETLTVSDSVTTRKYTIVVRGDADGSDNVSQEDYDLILEASACGAEIEEGSAEFYAADLNQDGAVDTFDAMMLDFYMDGEYSFN